MDLSELKNHCLKARSLESSVRKEIVAKRWFGGTRKRPELRKK